jgi:universal stress protein A
MPIRNILIATDFSQDSELAVELAVELARALGAKLHLLHAYYVPIQTTPTGFIAMPADVIASARTDAQARLEELAKQLARHAIAVQTHSSPQDPLNAILELARALPADLIAMGTRGLSGIQHVLLGSVAERVVRLAPCPVLTAKTSENRAR